MPTTEQVRKQLEAMSPNAIGVLNEVFWAAVVERVESLPHDMRTQAQDHLYALWALIDDTAQDSAEEEEPSAS